MKWGHLEKSDQVGGAQCPPGVFLASAKYSDSLGSPGSKARQGNSPYSCPGGTVLFHPPLSTPVIAQVQQDSTRVWHCGPTLVYKVPCPTRAVILVTTPLQSSQGPQAQESHLRKPKAGFPALYSGQPPQPTLPIRKHFYHEHCCLWKSILIRFLGGKARKLTQQQFCPLRRQGLLYSLPPAWKMKSWGGVGCTVPVKCRHGPQAKMFSSPGLGEGLGASFKGTPVETG